MDQGGISKTCPKESVSHNTNIFGEWDQIRWYVLTIPACHRGRIKGLDIEQNTRIDAGLPKLEVFSPVYEEVVLRNGKWVKSQHQLYFNYVFIRSSLRELYKLKTNNLMLFNFLSPSIVDGIKTYPYITDSAMENLRWVAASYNEVLPICCSDDHKLEKGDKVRIIKGQFKGAEATVVFKTGTGTKSVMVQIQNWMCVPLISVREDEYEFIELGGDRKRINSRLNNSRLANKLHEALLRLYKDELTEEDRSIAQKVLREYEHLNYGGEDEGRIKFFVLQAYAILRKKDLMQHTVGEIESLIKKTIAPNKQLYSQLCIALYGCTNNYRYYKYAHESVASWYKDIKIKRSRQLLIDRLLEYDSVFGH